MMISKKVTDIDNAAPSRETRHSIDDHMFGDFYPHAHDDDADHDHDDLNPGPLEDNPIWQRDNVMLTSVGIDIGSAGTQVIFSNVHLQRVGSSIAPLFLNRKSRSRRSRTRPRSTARHLARSSTRPTGTPGSCLRTSMPVW
jgi:hypothetical protein